MKKGVLIFVAVIIFMAVVWWVLGSRYQQDEVLENLEPDSDLQAIMEGGSESSPGPAAATVVPEVSVETAVLAAVGDYTGSGVATRVYDGDMFKHTVTADIPSPAAGTFYEGWLVMESAGGPQFFSTGKLEESGTAYVLNFSADQNYPEHTQVVITEETEANGLDNQPETHVLEGRFEEPLI